MHTYMNCSSQFLLMIMQNDTINIIRYKLLGTCNPTLANGCNPTTSFAQAFQHASSNDIHSHDE